MARLGAVVARAAVHHYGHDELLRRLARPFRFQSFGAVIGIDWHSSGITTSVLGALKRGLSPSAGELGLHVRDGCHVAEERRRSAEYGGRSVFGWEPPSATNLAARATGNGAS